MRHGYVEFKSIKEHGGKFYIKETEITEFQMTDTPGVYKVETKRTGISRTITTPDEFFNQLNEGTKMKL